MNQSKETKFITVRFGLIPELYDEIEKNRLSVPKAERLNRSAFVRKILYEYVKAHRLSQKV